MRKRIVSRTIVINEVTVTVFNPATREVKDEVFTQIGDYTPAQIEKAAKKFYSRNGSVVGACSVPTRREELRYMEESDFYANSKLMSASEAATLNEDK